MKLKYKVGDEIPCTLVIDEIDTDDPDCTYRIIVAGDNTVSGWASEEEVEEIISNSSPERKQAALRKKIEELEKQYNEIGKSNKQEEN